MAVKFILFGEKMSKFKPVYEIAHSTPSTLYLHIHSARRLKELFAVGDPSEMYALEVTTDNNQIRFSSCPKISLNFVSRTG